MKRNLVVLFATIFVGVVSCTKEADESFLTPKEDIRIFMSAPTGSNSGLKSGTIPSEKKAIKAGDTVDVQNISDVNILLDSEDEWKQPVNGTWSIMNIDNDRDVNRLDTIAIGSGNRGESGPVVSAKLKFLGLYQVNFISKAGTEFPFYIRHTGTPGITGDDWKFDYVFRLDKNAYQINNQQGYQGYTLYLKYQEGDFPTIFNEELNPSNEQNFRSLVYCGGNNFFTSKGGNTLPAKEFVIKRCKYSPGYVHFSFVADFIPAIDGKYEIYFYSGNFGWNWWSFKSVERSDWEKNGKIEFYPI